MKLLDDMALFVEVVQAQSFTRASAFLDIPKSTLSVRISKLEKHLGLRLLHRTTRKIALTEAGAIYYERASKVVDEAKFIHQQLDDFYRDPSGVLRVTLPMDLANLFFVPLLREFCEKYPKIQLDLNITPRKVDLISEPFDLAIRTGEQSDTELISRYLASFQGGIYASPDYLKQFGTPKKLDDLKQHHCLPFQHGTWHLINQDKKEETVEVKGQLRSNSLGITQRLASEGLGLALLPHLVAHIAENNRLQQVLPEWQSKPVPVYALTTTRLLPAKIQTFLAFLKEKFDQFS